MNEYLHSRLVELTDGMDHDVIADLVELYLTESLICLLAMREALRLDEMATLAFLAENLKSSSCNLGAEAVHLAAERLEAAIQQGIELDQAWDMVDELDRRLVDVHADMRAFARQHRP